MFFSELMKEASEIAGFFSSSVRHLLHLHIATGMQRYMICLRRCFKDDHQAMVQEGQMLIEYVTMNAIALRKILKKYDKVSMNASILLILFNVWVVKFFPGGKKRMPPLVTTNRCLEGVDFIHYRLSFG